MAELLRQGRAARARGDLLAALRLFEHASTLPSAGARPPLEAARVLRRLGLLGAARRRLDEVLARNGRLPGASLVAGLVADGSEDHERALEHFMDAIELDPSRPRAYALAARQLRLLGRVDEALEMASRGCELAGDDPQPADERALALVAQDAGAAAEALAEVVAAQRTDRPVWDAALILIWQGRFDEAFELVDSMEGVAREHATRIARYGLRRTRVRVAGNAVAALVEAHAQKPGSKLLATRPCGFPDEEPLDELDPARADLSEPRKYYLLDEFEPEGGAPGEPDAMPFARPSPVAFQYAVPNCFIHAELWYHDSHRQALVTLDGRFVPDLVPERCLMHWTRTALWDPDPAAEPLPLAFVLPMPGWDSYFHGVIEGLSTLAIYERLGLSCPIVVPGPLNDVHRKLIAASGVPADTPVLTAQDVRGRVIERAICPAPGRAEGDGPVTAETLQAWSRTLRRGLLEPRANGAGGDILYISRARAARRQLRNESELEDTLVRAVDARVVHMEDMSLEEQAAAVHGAKVVVAPHGAGLTNLLFAEPGTGVVELFPDTYVLPHYAWLAARLGHVYTPVTGPAKARARSQKDITWRVEIPAVMAALERMLGHRLTW